MKEQTDSQFEARIRPLPFGAIAAFASVTELVLALAVTRTAGGVQVALTPFAIAFPLLVTGAFVAVLWLRTAGASRRNAIEANIARGGRRTDGKIVNN